MAAQEHGKESLDKQMAEKAEKSTVLVKVEPVDEGGPSTSKQADSPNFVAREQAKFDEFRRGLARLHYKGDQSMKEVIRAIFIDATFPSVQAPAEQGLVERVAAAVSADAWSSFGRVLVGFWSCSIRI